MKMFLKLATSVVVAAATLLVVSLSAASAQPASKGTIAFLLSGPDIYYQTGMKGAQAAATQLGYSFKVYANPQVSPSVELSNVRAAIASGAVAITGFPVSYSSMGGTIKAASSAGVPTLMLTGYTPTYLGIKNFIGFETVAATKALIPDGQYMASHVTGQVGVITGQLGRGDAEAYRQGFLQGMGCKGDLAQGSPPLTCAGGKIQYVAQETGKWLRPTAYTAAQDLLAKYPNLKGLLVENEDMAVGVHTAAVAAHRDITIVSMNGAPYGQEGIKAGWLSATVGWSPAVEGLMGVRMIDGYLNHTVTGSHLYYENTIFVTKQNLATAGPKTSWTMYSNPALVAAAMKLPLLQPAVPPST